MTEPGRLLANLAGWTIVLGAAAVLATQLIGTPTPGVAGMQSLTPFALAPMLAVALIASWRHAHMMAVISALVGLGYLAVVTPLAFPRRGPELDERAETVEVLAANILFSNEQIGAVADELLAADADIVALIEVTPSHIAALRDHPVSARYPHRWEEAGRKASGLMIWSRYPITPHDRPADLRRALDAVVATPNGELRVVLVHPTPPVFDQAMWSHDMNAIDDAVRASTLPTVMLGDFNATIFHPPFRSALDRADLVDALPAAGGGLAMTWPTDEWLPPFVAIDHILIGERLAVDDAGAISIPGSDHRAVWATIGPSAPSSSG